MQTGNATISGNKVTGYTSATPSATLFAHINLATGPWLAAFGTVSPFLPAGSRIFLQPSGGTLTVAGGVVVPDGGIIILQNSEPTNVTLAISAGTLRISVES